MLFIFVALGGGIGIVMAVLGFSPAAFAASGQTVPSMPTHTVCVGDPLSNREIVVAQSKSSACAYGLAMTMTLPIAPSVDICARTNVPAGWTAVQNYTAAERPDAVSTCAISSNKAFETTDSGSLVNPDTIVQQTIVPMGPNYNAMATPLASLPVAGPAVQEGGR